MNSMCNQFLYSDVDNYFTGNGSWAYDDGDATESMNYSSGANNFYAAEQDFGQLDERANSGLKSFSSGDIALCRIEELFGELNALNKANSTHMDFSSDDSTLYAAADEKDGEVLNARSDDFLYETNDRAVDLPDARNDSNLMDLSFTLHGCNVITVGNDFDFLSTKALNQMLESDENFPPPAPQRENLSEPTGNESLVNVYDEFQEVVNPNAMMINNDDEFKNDDPRMQVIDQNKIFPIVEKPKEEDEEKEVPYVPKNEHDYAIVMFDPLVPIKIEVKDECSSDVDVWNDPGPPSPPIAESDPPSPLPCTRTRRSRAKAPQQVSINRAAKEALKGTKRQRNTSSMTTRKHRKVGNSLETSPSGSESDDSNFSMPPPKRAPAKRGKKTTSAKPTKSEVQRNTHNQNEKMRRTEMTRMLNKVRNDIPQFIYDKEKCCKSKASKQKVLNAARRYIDHLKDEQKGGAVTSQEYLYHNLKEELSATQAKLDKVVKKFLDRYYKVKGCHYNTRR